MLIQRFPPSNCLIQNTRNKVLALSLRGSKWIKKHEIQWAYVKKDNDQLEVTATQINVGIHAYCLVIDEITGTLF